jgi:hypothetical protein
MTLIGKHWPNLQRLMAGSEPTNWRQETNAGERHHVSESSEASETNAIKEPALGAKAPVQRPAWPHGKSAAHFSGRVGISAL